MKLLYSLPAWALPHLSGEAPLYCLPYDIVDGILGEGYFAATARALYRLEEGKEPFILPLSACRTFSVEKRYGCAALMVKREGTELELCRFTTGVHQPRFSSLVPFLEELAAGRPSEEENRDAECACPLCGMPYHAGSTVCRHCGKQRKDYRPILNATKGLWLMMGTPLLVAACSLTLRFISPSVQKIAINEYIYPPKGAVRGSLEGFLGIFLILILLELFSRALTVLQTRLSGVAGNRFALRLRSHLFRKAESLSLSSIGRHTISHLSTRINGDVLTIERFLITQVPSLVSQLLSFLVGIILVFAIQPTLALYLLIPLPFAFLYLVSTRRLFIRSNRKLRSAMQRFGWRQYDIIRGERQVKSFGREEEMIREHGQLIEEHTARSIEQARRGALSGLVFSLLVDTGSYLLLFFGNLWLFHGMMDVGTIGQFSAYTAIVYAPLSQFANLPHEWSTFRQSLTEVMALLEEEPEIKDPAEPKMPRIRGGVKVKSITFGYNSYEPVLKRLSLEIKPGEMIGLVGHSGCGKSTLVNLIMRLYEVDRGSIEIDGVNVRDMTQSYLHTHIGVVPQETQLFEGTVADNIRYSKPDATGEEIIAAAKVANAHDFILSLPEGYNTLVGDRGYSLSGGERQRVAIARALLHNPEILILDEATASLDTETERAIQEALDRLTVGRTTIAIAHRLSTLRNADRILVMDHGRIVESGTHKELLEKKGKYYRLVEAQAEAALGKDAPVTI